MCMNKKIRDVKSDVMKRWENAYWNSHPEEYRRRYWSDVVRQVNAEDTANFLSARREKDENGRPWRDE